MEDDDGEAWTTAQAAGHCGVGIDTFSKYVRIGLGDAPKPFARQPGRGGQDLYRAREVRAWHANRPGRGTRTDLRKPAQATLPAGIAPDDAATLRWLTDTPEGRDVLALVTQRRLADQVEKGN